MAANAKNDIFELMIIEQRVIGMTLEYRSELALRACKSRFAKKLFKMLLRASYLGRPELLPPT